MQKKRMVISLVAVMAVLGIMIACNKDAVSKINFIFKPNQGDGVVAVVGGEKITEDDLFAGVEKATIFQKQMEVYEMRMNKLRSILLEKLMNADPRKKGMSNDEYMAKFVTGKAEPKKADIDKFIKERNIPKERINEQIRERIKMAVKREMAMKAIENFMAIRTKNKPVTVFLEKPPRPIVNVALGEGPIYGPKDAPITIIEYTDFQCPYCAKAHDIVNEVKDKYKGKIKMVLKHYPLPFHKEGKVAANASFCADEQGSKYIWKLNDIMFKNQNKLKSSGLVELAKKIGLDTEKFSSCLKSNKYMAKVEKDMAEGQKLKLNSVPAIFINGKLINGAQPFDVFAEIINEELKRR